MSLKSWFELLPLITLACAFATLASASEDSGSTEWSGSASLAYWSGSRQLDDAHDFPAGALWLKGDAQAAGIRVIGEGWLRSDDLARHANARGGIREAYLHAVTGRVDWRIGRQIVVWGRADQLNPTDNLTPRDFTRLVPELGDDRLGVDAVQIRTRIHDTSLEMLWLPRFRPNVTPLPQGARRVEPRGHEPFAIKLDNSGGGGVDWSLSWFSGFDLMPTLRPDSSGSLEARHPRVDVIGADFAAPIGRLGLRGEVAYTRTVDSDGTDALEKNPYLYGVFGVERSFLSTLDVSIQAYAYQVRRYRDPRDEADPVRRTLAIRQAVLAHQIERSEQGVAVRISNKWWNETLETEVTAVVALGGQGWLLKPKFAYAIDDHLRLTVGADRYGGHTDTPYGLLSRNSLLYGELRAFF